MRSCKSLCGKGSGGAHLLEGPHEGAHGDDALAPHRQDPPEAGKQGLLHHQALSWQGDASPVAVPMPEHGGDKGHTSTLGVQTYARPQV